MKEREIETKFYLTDLSGFEKKLINAGAKLDKKRVFEVNLRFDTHEGKLSEAHQVLRLRRDSRVRMTYKGPSEEGAQAAVRKEIEFELSDFEAGQHLLEALGYQISFIYEKFRTTYWLDETEVVLDEMPFGNFTELEGPDTQSLQKTAEILGLDWGKRCNLSYLALFEHLKEKHHPELYYLTFDAFERYEIKPENLGVLV